MNIFSRVTLKSLRKNRARTIVTIIGIMLSTALICAVTTSIASVQKYAVGYLEYTDGKFHGSEKFSDIDTYNKIKASDQVAETACLSYIGYADIDSDIDSKPYIYICGFEESMEGIVPVHIASGRMPQNKNEILIPEHLIGESSLSFNEGDVLTLDIGDRKIDLEKLAEIEGLYLDRGYEDLGTDYFLDQSEPFLFGYPEDYDMVVAEYLDIKEQREFTVVGTYRYPNFEYYRSAGFTALTVPDEYDGNTQADIYYCMKNMKDIYDFKEANGLEGDTHSNLLLLSGVSKYNSFYSVILGLASIVIGLIVFGSVMLIYNAFSISVSERTKQFGLLSSIGATKKQLKKMVRFEASALSIIGIPLGILLGIAGMWVTFLAIGSRFASFFGDAYPEPLRVYVSFTAIIAACVIAFITIMISAWIPSRRATKITAVEAIRQSSDIKQKKYVRTPKFVGKIFGLSGILAHKYFKRSKKKYRATIVSLFMSIVLFVSAYSFTAYLVGAVSDTYETLGMDYILTLSNITDEGTEVQQSDLEEILNDVKNTEHITKATYVASVVNPVSMDKDIMRKEALEKEFSNDRSSRFPYEPDKRYTYMEVCFVKDEDFEAFAEECGLDAEKFMDKNSPNGIAVDNSVGLDAESGRIVRIRFFDKDDFDLKSRIYDDIEGYMFYMLNDEGQAVYYAEETFYYDEINDEKFIVLPFDECTTEITYHVGAVTDKKPYFHDSGLTAIIYPMSAVKAVYGDAFEKNHFRYYYPVNSDDVYGGEKALYEMFEEKGYSGGVNNIAEGVEAQRNIVVIIKVFAYGFIILISLIAAANVFNTITTNINLRRRDFAMLRSVGMTSKGMKNMLNFECVLYGTKALLYGLPVSAGVTYLIYRSVNEGIDMDFFIPWRAVLIAVLSVFIVVFSTMMFSMNKIKNDNPIETLKNENL